MRVARRRGLTGRRARGLRRQALAMEKKRAATSRGRPGDVGWATVVNARRKGPSFNRAHWAEATFSSRPADAPVVLEECCGDAAATLLPLHFRNASNDVAATLHQHVRSGWATSFQQLNSCKQNKKLDKVVETTKITGANVRKLTTGGADEAQKGFDLTDIAVEAQSKAYPNSSYLPPFAHSVNVNEKLYTFTKKACIPLSTLPAFMYHHSCPLTENVGQNFGIIWLCSPRQDREAEDKKKTDGASAIISCSRGPALLTMVVQSIHSNLLHDKLC